MDGRWERLLSLRGGGSKCDEGGGCCSRGCRAGSARRRRTWVWGDAGAGAAGTAAGNAGASGKGCRARRHPEGHAHSARGLRARGEVA